MNLYRWIIIPALFTGITIVLSLLGYWGIRSYIKWRNKSRETL